MSSRSNEARKILNDTFGFEDFRAGQWDVVRAILSGRDVVGVLPTGGGKSVCYQVPALMFPACTLVVSPLVALMTDQVDRLRQVGVAAFALHSSMSSGEVNDAMFEAHAGRVKLLYVAPERLESERFRSQLSTVSLSLLAVDEAHCISEWGHDFRPAYRQIMRLFDLRPRVPVAAFTATATPDVRKDIVKNLDLQQPIEIVRGFDRSNLAFRVERTPHKIEWLARHRQQHPDEPAIIYAGSRKRVENITIELRKRGHSVESYHAGLQAAQRTRAQSAYVSGSVPTLVATNAFGMGIDKSDVRHVIHTDLTLTLEAYYQEAGRAGRDGRDATCTILYQPEDRRLMDLFITSSYPEVEQIHSVLDYLFDRARVGVGGMATDDVRADAASIAADLHVPTALVNGVLNLLEREGLILRTSRSGTAQLRSHTSARRLHEFVENCRDEVKVALLALERIMPASPGSSIAFNPTSFIRKNGLTTMEFGSAIRSLHAANLAHYEAVGSGGGIAMLAPRSTQRGRGVDVDTLAQRRAHARTKLDIMIRYAETTQCKRNTILNYFGDDVIGMCGRCSSCLASTVVELSSTSDLLVEVIRAVYELGGRFGRHVVADVLTGAVSERVMDYSLMKMSMWNKGRTTDRAEVLRTIDRAIDQGLLVVATGQYPTLGVSDEGRRVASPLPKPMRLKKRGKDDETDEGTLRALVAWREEVAGRLEVAPSSLISLQQLQRLAMDLPTAQGELEAGKHGSGLFLAEYGHQITDVVRRVRQDREEERFVDNDVSRVIKAVTPQRGLHDVARMVRLTPAATARYLQRGIEAGLDVQRGALVDDALYEKVCDFLRENRFAKLRHVREQVGDVDLPTLRVAIAFARHQLFGV
jgi:ATP-dependent DNA helicase RecQ